jgi:hypothetical protein
MYEGQEIFVPASLLSETRPAQSSKNNDISPAQPQNVSPATDLPAASAGGCSCTGPDLDCDDFDPPSEAQACYDKCIAETGRDVHRLDGNDNDSLACENLPQLGLLTTAHSAKTLHLWIRHFPYMYLF